MSELREAGPAVRAGLARGVALFNRGDFWGSHEAWEGVWLEAADPQRRALQGLIQAGAAFHKLIVQDNRSGARRLLRRALDGIAPAGRSLWGIELVPLRTELERWDNRLRDGGPLDGRIIGLPRIAWTTEADGARIRVESATLRSIERGGRRSVLIGVRSGNTTGWGECRLPWRHHGIIDALRDSLLPSLLAEPLVAPSTLGIRWSNVSDERYGAAGLESAVWDLWARRCGWALHEAFGLAPRDLRLSGRVEPAADARTVEAHARPLIARGYQHLVLTARPNADRRVLAPAELSVEVAVDLGARYRPADWYAIRALGDLRPTYLARPVPADHPFEAGRLCRWLEPPVAIGPFASVEAAHDAIRVNALDVLLIDPMYSGPRAALAMADLAEGAGIPALLMSQAITEVGARSSLAVGCHPACTLPAEIGPASRRLLTAAAGTRPGTARPSERPGIGVDPVDAGTGSGVSADRDVLTLTV